MKISGEQTRHAGRDGPATPWKRHLYVIEHVAMRLGGRWRRYVALDDLVAAGCLGLMETMARFDEQRAASFSRYAKMKVRGAILDALRDEDPFTRGTRIGQKEVRRAEARLLHLLGRPPDAEEVARELGCSLDRYHELLARMYMQRPQRLPPRVNLTDLPDGLFSYGRQGPYDTERLRLLGQALRALPPRLRFVIEMHYFEGMSLHDLALYFEVSQARVSQLHRQALARLRTGFGDYDNSALCSF